MSTEQELAAIRRVQEIILDLMQRQADDTRSVRTDLDRLIASLKDGFGVLAGVLREVEQKMDLLLEALEPKHDDKPSPLAEALRELAAAVTGLGALQQRANEGIEALLSRIPPRH
jgi:hypothetical protein